MGNRLVDSGMDKHVVRVFAENYVLNGSNAKRAAVAAGYTEDAAVVMCRRMLNYPAVQIAIRQAQMKYIGGELVNKALAVLYQVMNDEEASTGARVDAAKTILDRAGIGKSPIHSDNSQKQINEMSYDELMDIINKHEQEAIPHETIELVNATVSTE